MEAPQPRRKPGRPIKGRAADPQATVAAAVPIFATYGYDGASLRKIAADVGIDVALISHQFGSKLGLWKAVVDRFAEMLLTRTRALVSDDASGLDSPQLLRRAMTHVIDMFCDDPKLALMVVHHAPDEGAHFDYMYEQIIVPYERTLLPLATDALKVTGRKDIDPVILISSFVGAVAMTVVNRPFLSRTDPASRDDGWFRDALKRTVLANFVVAAKV